MLDGYQQQPSALHFALRIFLQKIDIHICDFTRWSDDNMSAYALDMNTGTKVEALDVQQLRDKRCPCYFIGKYDVQLFVKLDAVLMPKVLQMVAMIEVCGWCL